MINKVGRFFLAKGVKFVWLFQSPNFSLLSLKKRTLRIFVGVPFFVHNRFCIAASIWLFSKLSK